MIFIAGRLWDHFLMILEVAKKREEKEERRRGKTGGERFNLTHLRREFTKCMLTSMRHIDSNNGRKRQVMKMLNSYVSNINLAAPIIQIGTVMA